MTGSTPSLQHKQVAAEQHPHYVAFLTSSFTPDHGASPSPPITCPQHNMHYLFIVLFLSHEEGHLFTLLLYTTMHVGVIGAMYMHTQIYQLLVE